jgi:hypothetical protein
MNVQLAQSLKVISILSTQTLVQNVVLVQMHVRLKQLAWANTIKKSMTNHRPDFRTVVFLCTALSMIDGVYALKIPMKSGTRPCSPGFPFFMETLIISILPTLP